jgi:hypothetical protein
MKHDIVPCSHMKTDAELLDSKQGYQHSTEGPKLNNLLPQKNGLYSVAFLNEFDKPHRKHVSPS